MKKNQIFAMAAVATMALMAAVSCEQLSVHSISDEPSEIVLNLNAKQLVVETKAVTAVDELPTSLNWGATRGTTTELVEWNSTSASVSSGKIHTGKFQTLTPVAYNFYVSNAPMTVSANTSVTVTGGTTGIDVICGRVVASTSATPEVKLQHVFARTGSITIGAEKGTLTNVSYAIKAKVGENAGTTGTYNLRTNTWSETSGLDSETAITGTTDMYVIPGEYTISATATYSRGDYSVTETRYGDVTLIAGKINDIQLTWPDSGSQIEIVCLLDEWSNNTNTVSLQTYCDAVDLGYRTSGGKTVLFAKWNIGASAEDQYGDYFSWAETKSRHGVLTWAFNDDGWRDDSVVYDWRNSPYYWGIIGIGNDPVEWTKYHGNVASNSSSGHPDGLTELEPDDDAAHVQWGGDWRMMNDGEINFLRSCRTEAVSVEATTWFAGYEFYAIKIYGQGEYSNNYILLPSAGHLEANYSSFDAYSFVEVAPGIQRVYLKAWYWTAMLSDRCSYAQALCWSPDCPVSGTQELQGYEFVTEKQRYIAMPIRAVREVD